MESLHSEWAPMPGYEGYYEVAAHGAVRRVGSASSLKPYICKGGYEHVGLCVGNVVKKLPVHRCVLLAFVGSPPPGHEGCHNNGVRRDNRRENLRWATRAENHADKALHGTQQVGVRNPNSKFEEEVVAAIRVLLGAKFETAAIARVTGVSRRTVYDIATGRTRTCSAGLTDEELERRRDNAA
jgi:hypothetical protein